MLCLRAKKNTLRNFANGKRLKVKLSGSTNPAFWLLITPADGSKDVRSYTSPLSGKYGFKTWLKGRNVEFEIQTHRKVRLLLTQQLSDDTTDLRVCRVRLRYKASLKAGLLIQYPSKCV